MTAQHLLGVVGSTAYGLATPESDIDRLGVFMEPLRVVVGLSGSSKVENSKVTKDPDLTLHEIGKFCRLALAGNPTVTELLWLPEYELMTSIGRTLVEGRDLFLSQAFRKTYGGYALQQLKRLKERGDFSSDLKKRTEKHGRHCMRLIIQGKHVMEHGEVKIRLTESEIGACRTAGRMADSDVDTFESMVMEGLEEFDEVADRSPLPEKPDRDAVNEMLVDLRLMGNRE